MSKLLKGILLLSVIVFAVNCQAKHTDSKFQVVPDEVPLNPDFQPPEDSDEEIEEGNKPTNPEEKPEEQLTRLDVDELLIANTTSFTKHLNSEFSQTSTDIEFMIGNSERFNKTIFENTDETLVEVNITLFERAGGVLEYIKTGVDVKTNDNNSISIVYKDVLKKALPELGTYAKYRVDVYIKDKRSPIKYLMTQHTFNFTVYGNNF